MRARERLSAVTVAPGQKFEGDQIVYLYGQAFDLANAAWALWHFVRNEERRTALNPHWTSEPINYLTAFLVDAIQASDDEAFDAVCAHYKLWGFRR